MAARLRVQRLLYALAALREGALTVEVAHWFLERPAEPAVARFTLAERPALEELPGRAPRSSPAAAFRGQRASRIGPCVSPARARRAVLLGRRRTRCARSPQRRPAERPEPRWDGRKIRPARLFGPVCADTLSGSASGARLPARADEGMRAGSTAPGALPCPSHTKQPPGAVGLYDPRFEHDACGVGMVARLDNRPPTRSSRGRSRRWRTSSIAVPPARIPRPATAPGS